MYDREIELWTVRLTGGREELRVCEAVLSDDERRRAGAFQFDHLTVRFTFGRGILRLLAGWYLHAAPAQIQFAYGAAGKPCIQTPLTDLRFNLSHSDEMALYAFARGCEIGVDIERDRPNEEAIDITEWTRKEAYLKARGEGWSVGGNSGFTTHGWTLLELSPAPGYKGALAYEGKERPLRWQPIASVWEVVELVKPRLF